MRAKSAFLVGAGTAFLFDPREGKRRRRLLFDRSLAFGRRLRRVGIGKLKFVGGHAQGMLARLRRMGTRPSVAVDDQAVVQRVRSDALRDVGVSPREVAVEVQDGFVRLSGSIASPTLSTDLVERVRKVPGVGNVSAELRVVGD